MRGWVWSLVLVESLGLAGAAVGHGVIRVVGLALSALVFAFVVIVAYRLIHFAEWVVHFDRHRFGNGLQLARGWLQMDRLDDARAVITQACDDLLRESMMMSSLGVRGGLRLIALYRRAERRGVRIEWPVWNCDQGEAARRLVRELERELRKGDARDAQLLAYETASGQWVWRSGSEHANL